ncbi:MAG: pilus assembly protein TadG-related protein [Candidatus Dormibacteria bacterium]
MHPNRTRRHQRRNERGQVLIVVALMSVVLLGASSVAIDLSGQSNLHRNLQNWTDDAAISGVRVCDTSCDARTEVSNALTSIKQSSPWSSAAWPPNGTINGTCKSPKCSVTVTGPSGFTQYTVKVSSPPDTPYNAAYNNSTNYLEVEVSTTTTTSFSSFIGIGTTVSTGHSVAVDSGPPAGPQYTFYSNTEAESGNQAETVYGDSFLGQGYEAQSSGQSGLCIFELPSSTQSNTAADQGRVVFSLNPPHGSPAFQHPADPVYRATNTNPTGTSGACPATVPNPPGQQAVPFDVQQPPPSSNADCPAGSSAVSYTALYGASTMCYVASSPYPNIPSPVPTLSSGPGSSATPLCTGNEINSSTAPGVYVIGAGCTVGINFDGGGGVLPGNINCVSLILNSGAQVDYFNKKSHYYWTSYAFNGSSDSTATNDMTALGIAPPPSGSTYNPCPGSGIYQDRSVIWESQSAARATGGNGAFYNGTTGGGGNDQTLIVGTIYLPGQQIGNGSNQTIEVDGSVYCDVWNVQSGNHDNPTVSYDASGGAQVVPILRLVE